MKLCRTQDVEQIRVALRDMCREHGYPLVSDTHCCDYIVLLGERLRRYRNAFGQIANEVRAEQEAE